MAATDDGTRARRRRACLTPVWAESQQTPPSPTARHECRTRRVGEDPLQRGGERAAWHAKARSAGLTLSDLVRRSVGRVHTWTVAHADMERERTQQVARIGNNLNQIARWANTHKGAIEAVEVIGHLTAIERSLATLARFESQDSDAD